MSGDKLNVLLYDRQVGTLERSREGVNFTYANTWLEDVRSGRGGHALSISMPLHEREHGPRVVEPFIAGFCLTARFIGAKSQRASGLIRGTRAILSFFFGRSAAIAQAQWFSLTPTIPMQIFASRQS
ncbi:hypothetical protein RHI9324_05447 [Rhizobium sp. CECT 9324]|nr:HipA N-terminal domain-containing protein [Rhizobium sp. CECT 9324]CAH0343710.1 hypothetical protein RHI9324_05447 [Rhizobium sp. CECT 9324]